MPTDFYIDAECRVVFSKATGAFGRHEAIGHMDRLMRHPSFRPEFNQLADFRLVSKMDLSAEEVRGLASRTIFGPASKRAFVVSSDLQFGLSRVFGAYREIEGENGIIVFREMTAALSWLSLSAEPDPRMFTNLGSLTDDEG